MSAQPIPLRRARTSAPPPGAPDLDSPAFDALLRQLTADFAATAAQHDADGSFPHANFERLQREGLLAFTVARADGGLGAGLQPSARLVAAVARGEPSTALVLVMQLLLHANHAGLARWPAGPRERVLRETVRDGALINALRVEPELGTPARGGLPATTARRTPDGWRLSGHKLYSTGIPRLRWLLVWAKSDDATPLVGSWLVPRDAPGIRVIESWDHLGMRATGSHEVVFDDVLLPLDHAVDVHPADAVPAFDGRMLAWMAVLLASLYDGVARAAHDWLLGWLHARRPANLGAALATLPRVQEAVGRIEALLHANRVLIDAAARAVDTPGAPVATATDSGLLKLLVTNQAIEAVAQALELSGNPGLSRSHPLQRHHRDVLCSRIHTPQNDSVLVAAGRAALAAAQPPT